MQNKYLYGRPRTHLSRARRHRHRTRDYLSGGILDIDHAVRMCVGLLYVCVCVGGMIISRRRRRCVCVCFVCGVRDTDATRDRTIPGGEMCAGTSRPGRAGLPIKMRGFSLSVIIFVWHRDAVRRRPRRRCCAFACFDLCLAHEER